MLHEQISELLMLQILQIFEKKLIIWLVMAIGYIIEKYIYMIL